MTVVNVSPETFYIDDRDLEDVRQGEEPDVASRGQREDDRVEVARVVGRDDDGPLRGGQSRQVRAPGRW